VGIAAASSDLVLVCDADDRVVPGWVAALVDALARDDAVAGAVAGSGTRAPSGFGFGFLPAFATCSAAFHKHVWDAVGGFDESLPTCEDLDLAWRIQLGGFTLGQCPAALVHYRGAANAGDEFRTWFRYGRYQPRLLARFRAEGLRPEPLPRVVAKWAQLVITCYRLAGADAARRAWCREAGRRCGRVVGSIRERALYL
jgi:GT2 family glycosyltransferase